MCLVSPDQRVPPAIRERDGGVQEGGSGGIPLVLSDQPAQSVLELHQLRELRGLRQQWRVRVVDGGRALWPDRQVQQQRAGGGAVSEVVQGTPWLPGVSR
ncbi:hypothetical protein M5D96_004895 [Drosophila gunungcola]|uniref:Uncharacterized protein n=1 Tax=Drosophila gunungcola TaxID=103775 RepID=A0A9P9YUX3_9MUSC|nr:hypothetical protein M5D96_004895 [Drosophila gunungcola]